MKVQYSRHVLCIDNHPSRQIRLCVFTFIDLYTPDPINAILGNPTIDKAILSGQNKQSRE